ncbi:hypothetical protein niasHT_037596 [Heterodera trifolii]|uniref:Protein kinase domain-containing protein n=1 Tax=Heterodera trifolii TaxID=157864 RepID=A0ABD2I8I5_9BILA
MGNKHSLNGPSTADEFKQYPHHQQPPASPRGAFYLQQWAAAPSGDVGPPLANGTCRNGKMGTECNGTTPTEMWRNGQQQKRRRQQQKQKRNSGTEMATPKNDNSSNSPLSPSSRNSMHSGDGAAAPAPPSVSPKMAEQFAASADATPTGRKNGGGGGFLAQLFNHSTGRQQKKAIEAEKHLQQSPNGAFAAPPLPSNSVQPTMAPQIEHQQQQQPFVLLPDRPAIRLDSRLVCKYEVLSVVGKGSFSQVLRVQDRISKRFYAVKLVSTEQDFGAVNNELSILSRVQHPFVIRLEEVFRSATKLFIVMEMASGGEMYDRVVAKGRYSESEARMAIKMLLTGLEYLHSMHITHRDLKPENLLYSDTRQEARLLITDFGLAHQSRASDEKMTDTCGTPEYIAPEILLRVPYSNRVDLWAVGVIAYILMSGIMPFDDDCRSRLYTHIITANYVYYPQFWSGSEQAKHFVDTLLDTSPDHRPSASDALHHHWVTGDRPHSKAAMGRRTRARIEAATEEAEEDGTTVSGEDANGTTVQRTKSSRSIRSVTRSDHGHRVDPREVDQLAEDLQRLAQKQRERERRHHHHHQHNNSNSRADGGGGGVRRHHYSSPYTHQQQQQPITKNYGVF